MKYLSNIKLYLQLEHYYKSGRVRLEVGNNVFVSVQPYFNQNLVATYRGEVINDLGSADEVSLG